MNSARYKAYLFLIIVTMIWGFAPPVIKYTLREFDPGVFLVYRFAISSILSLLYFSVTGDYKGKQIGSNLPRILAYALFSTTFSLGALFLGLDRTSVLDTNILTSITPLLVVIAGAIFFHEKVPHREKLGSILAFMGTLIAIVLPVLLGEENELQLSGNLFILTHMFTDIAAILLVKELLRKKISSGFLANLSFIVGFITLTPVVLIDTSVSDIIKQITTIPFQYHLGVWYMAVLSGTLAYYLRNRAQKTIEVGKAGLFGYLHPVFSTPLAIFWLGEAITPYFIAGAVLIILGVFIAEVNSNIRKKIHLHIPHLQHHK